MLITHEIDPLKAKTLLRLACKKFDQFFFPVKTIAVTSRFTVKTTLVASETF